MITTIRIRSANDTNPLNRIPVKAVKRGYFAIHREAIPRDDAWLEPLYWNVTHIPSGLLVGWFWNLQHAADYADWLNQQPIDWRRIGSKKDARRMVGQRFIFLARAQIHHETIPFSVAMCQSEGWMP